MTPNPGDTPRWYQWPATIIAGILSLVKAWIKKRGWNTENR